MSQYYYVILDIVFVLKHCWMCWIEVSHVRITKFMADMEQYVNITSNMLFILYIDPWTERRKHTTLKSTRRAQTSVKETF